MPHVAGVRCNWCSKERPAFRIHRLSSGQAICDYCLEWHNHALEVAGGTTEPIGCQGCQQTWPMLKAITPGEDVPLYVVPKDGLYQLLCKQCVVPYVTTRADLYKGTEFGQHLNI